MINPTWAELGESRRGAGGGTSRPVVKKHAASLKIFVHFT